MAKRYRLLDDKRLYSYMRAITPEERLSSWDAVTKKTDTFYDTSIGTIDTTDGWYNYINIRHRNGLDNGTSYGLQLKSGLVSTTDAIYYRHNSGGSWGNWYQIATSETTNSLSTRISNIEKHHAGITVTGPADYDFSNSAWYTNYQRVQWASVVAQYGSGFSIVNGNAVAVYGHTMVRIYAHLQVDVPASYNIQFEVKTSYGNTFTHDTGSFGTGNTMSSAQIGPILCPVGEGTQIWCAFGLGGNACTTLCRGTRCYLTIEAVA